MFKFQPNTTISLSGTTGSGKTKFAYKCLQNIDDMFETTPPEKILYCYGIYQSLFDEMQMTVKSIHFHKGIPTTDYIDEFIQGKTHCMIILDDLMDQTVKNTEIELLFTRGAHHKGITVMYINQNMFNQGKHARTISLNTHYIILLRSPRQVSQIQHLGQQIFPRRSKALVESYEDCMRLPFGYLLINLSPYAEENERLMTRIFPGEHPIVYIPV